MVIVCAMAIASDGARAAEAGQNQSPIAPAGANVPGLP
jgi:hypothetical protein